MQLPWLQVQPQDAGLSLHQKLTVGKIPTPTQSGKDEDLEDSQGNGHQEPKDHLMIFDDSDDYETMCQSRLTTLEAYVFEPAMAHYMKWSELSISFDCIDHTDHIPQQGKFPWVVDPIN